MSIDPTEKILIGCPEAAKLLSCSERHVWSMVKAGVLPSCRLGNRVLFRPVSLAEWAARNETGGNQGDQEPNFRPIPQQQIETTAARLGRQTQGTYTTTQFISRPGE